MDLTRANWSSLKLKRSSIERILANHLRAQDQSLVIHLRDRGYLVDYLWRHYEPEEACPDEHLWSMMLVSDCWI